MYVGKVQSAQSIFAMIAGLRSRFARFLCGVLLLCGLGFSTLHAQSAVTTGSIRGVLADQSGAVVVGASVQVQRQGTGIATNQLSNREGIFVFSALDVGDYQVRVTAPGFRPANVNSVTVHVGQTTTVDVRLHPGSYSQSMEVTASVPVLRTTESSSSTVVSRSLLSGLPLNGRRYTDFALLTPNASPDGQSGLVSFAGEQGGEDTGYANGNGANVFTLDGANSTSNYFGNARGGERVPYVFGENSIQEFQVTVSPYSAAYGGGATGFVNTVTKSGTDTFHGNAFYYNRNSGTGANDAIDKAASVPKPLDVLQQFGGSIGGPVVHKKLWFFADYEQQAQNNPISVINSDYQSVTQADFGVPLGVALPAPNGPLPVPSSLSEPDPTNPIYLQQVSNALHAIHSNLGTQSRYRNDLALFSKIDYSLRERDQLYLSLNLNRFDSPHGEITSSNTPLFGISTLANSYVRDYQAAAGWTHTFSSNLLNNLHLSFSQDLQYSTPTGFVDPTLPSILLATPSLFELGNAGFAVGRTKEWQWELADQVDYVWGKHNFKFGIEGNITRVTDSAGGGFDPDAQRENGTLAGTYGFSTFPNFALGIYDSFSQAAGSPNLSFRVPYLGFYAQDTFQVLPRLTLEFGLREDFQIYPQPKENPAFPLTGQFPNQYQRLTPRFGFAWQPFDKTVVRGGFGMFYENFNGLNYRNSVIANGLLSQQSSVSLDYNEDLPPNQQLPVFPNRISGENLFTAPNISIVDPSFRFPYILQSSLQIEREILRDTTLSVGTMWTHGVHLISSSAYDLNLMPPTGTTTYITCAAGTTEPPCNGPSVTLPNLDSRMLQEGRINPNLGQINALISPGINNYNSLFIQLQRRMSNGLALQAAYTYAKDMMSNGVDFNNQFDFSNTHAPYLLDQRHRLVISGVYQPFSGRHFDSRFASGLLSNWTVSTIMLFSSGRPYAALLDNSCTTFGGDSGDALIRRSAVRRLDTGDEGGGSCPEASSTLNDSAVNQSTSNSALGINGAGPSPAVGLNSFYGPWTQQIDVGLARQIPLTERQSIILQVQAFNLLNHANYYVQNGNGVNPVQYLPAGNTCGDGQSQTQTCYLVPESGFKQLQIINALYGPRVFQFSFKWNF